MEIAEFDKFYLHTNFSTNIIIIFLCMKFQFEIILKIKLKGVK